MNVLRLEVLLIIQAKDTRGAQDIRQKIAAIPTEMLANTMENAEKRAHYAVQANGGHLRDIIYKH